jgi:hypothetical protein
MLRESQKALLYLEHEAQLAAPNQLTNFPRTTMSLPKTALTAIFLLSVCSPALAETTGGKDSQAATPQNTKPTQQSRSEDSKTPKTQPIKLNQNILNSLQGQPLHCCSCTGSFNPTTPLDLHIPSPTKQ